MTAGYTPIADYDWAPFAATVAGGAHICHNIYQRGTGAPVVIIQELPGIGPETLRMADEFVARGFAVVLPHLFGPLDFVDEPRHPTRGALNNILADFATQLQ